jgi:hypothetical protein
VSAPLTDRQLEAITPPVGVVGEEQEADFVRSIQTAIGACNAADARLLQLVRRALLEGWWRCRGCHSPEHWVAAQVGLGAARARRLVLMARELGAYPATASAFAAGLLTEDHVFEIVTRVHPAHEEAIATGAGAWSIGQLRRWAANFPKPVEPEPTVEPDEPPVEPTGAAPDPFGLPAPDPTPTRVEPDVVVGHWDHRGRYVGRWDLEATRGALLEKALQVGQSKVFTERTGADVDDDAVAVGRTTWADALERVLHAALDGLDPASVAGGRPGDRYQVLVHVDLQRLERSRLHRGPILTRAQRQHLTCDADCRVVLCEGTRPVDLGRRQHTVEPLLRALIEDRDRGCRNCGRRGFLHIHHLVHWEDGGRTDQDNLCGLCPSCHRLVHSGELRIVGDPTCPDGLACFDRRGRPLPRPGPIPPPDGPPGAPNPFTGPARGRMPRRSSCTVAA